MEMYEVLLESKTKNSYLLKITASGVNEVKRLAKEKIVELGWAHYGYAIKVIRKVK